MNQRAIVIGLLVFVLAAFGGLIYYDAKHGHKFEKLMGGKNRPVQNWKWEDSWDGNGPSAQPDKAAPQPKTETPAPTGPQLIAGTYTEALQKSGEFGKPVLVFFTAEWCTWCKKMKAETMVDGKVQAGLKNYILVYVDTDKDRAPARKFGIESLPSYVITNSKEEKLKADSGFKNSETFAGWLNNPNLLVQPKSDKQPQVTPPVKPKEPERKRPLRRNQQPPMPQNPNITPPNCGPNG
jgi:thiol:disulfide interchange protein